MQYGKPWCIPVYLELQGAKDVFYVE